MSQDDRNIRVQPKVASEADTECLSQPGTSGVSDVVLAESATGAAPSFPLPQWPPSPPAVAPADEITAQPSPQQESSRDRAPMAMLPGARVDDFEIVKMLGRGAFGHVYLARQL